MHPYALDESAAAEAEATGYEWFWRNSDLSRATAPAFGARVRSYVPPARAHSGFGWPGASRRVAMPRDRLQRLMADRVSSRTFGTTPLSARALERLLAACRRGTSASAGALYPVEVFAICLAVRGPFAGQVVHYDAAAHAITIVGGVPSWDDLEAVCNSGFESPPAVLLVFALCDDEVLAKYGERGGRFGLIEVGHAAQNVALRVAADGLVGCELGGLCDDEARSLLGIADRRSRIALAYAVGAIPGRRRRARRVAWSG